MANNWYLVSALTGGAEGALDALDGAALADGDRAIAIVDDQAAFYLFDADNTEEENPPNVILPDTGSGGWILKKAIGNHCLIDNFTDFITNTITSVFGSNDIIISGGSGNNIDSETTSGQNLIITGVSNEILGESEQCCILNGYSCEISHGITDYIINGDRDAIASKLAEQWHTERNLILNGSQNTITTGAEEWSQQNTIVGGIQCSIYDSYLCHVTGYKNKIHNAYISSISGAYGMAHLRNQRVLSGGVPSVGETYYLIEGGESQFSEVITQAKTTDSTATETLAGSTQKITLKSQRLWRFKVEVSAFQVAGTAGSIGDSAFWEITGGIKNVGANIASGTITISGEYTDIPTEGETFTFNDTTYTWTATPTLDTDIEIPSNRVGVKSGIYAKLSARPDVFSVEYSYAMAIVAHPFTGVTPNTWVFTESSVMLTMDGSGTFGGTTAGADGTVSLVGTPQGTGVPGVNDRDAAAAAWSVAVTADDTNKSLKIAVTGEADKTIHWTAKVSLVEVG